MIMLHCLCGLSLLTSAVLACGGSDRGPTPPPPVDGITVLSGNEQQGGLGAALGAPARVGLRAAGVGAAREQVAWVVTAGGGQVSADTTISGADGTAEVSWTLGSLIGGQSLKAVWVGTDSVTFHATGTAPFGASLGGNNAVERYSSDLWVAGGYAYTGTWNWFQRTAGVLGVIKVFRLNGSGTPALVDSVNLVNVITVSDLEVSPDGQWLVATAEGGTGQGLYVYSLADPAKPAQIAFTPVTAGLHTGSLSVIGGKLYAFTAKNPSSPALNIFDLSDAGNNNITLASSTPIPPTYGIHDTFTRDGICFAFVWNEGVYVYDVGNGVQGGSPTNPVKIGGLRTVGGEAHNGWWYWSPGGEKKYLFVGQEGPASIGSTSSGDIHVVDVSDLTAPVEVASYSMPGAGAHNFWLDEPNERLYAAYYNGGVVALDISGALSGNLANREIARIRPGGAGNTYTWGVMLSGGSLYALDMLSGLWQLAVP
jgi:hypothetical protein